MNRADLIATIAYRDGFSHRTATAMVTLVLRAIAVACREDGEVKLRGFGTFTVRPNKREYKLPNGTTQKGKPSIKFVAGNSFRKYIRGERNSPDFGAEDEDTETETPGYNRSI
tara:strand:- start:21438 stop:21776 length:339 start_codon:yes stop_codon:yes gene_type:complete